MCPSSNPSAISSLHSAHLIRTRCNSWYEGPATVILLLYAASDYIPATCHSQKTIPTVFLKLVFSTTILNRPTKVLKSP